MLNIFAVASGGAPCHVFFPGQGLPERATTTYVNWLMFHRPWSNICSTGNSAAHARFTTTFLMPVPAQTGSGCLVVHMGAAVCQLSGAHVAVFVFGI